MTGQELKKKLAAHGASASDVARQMGISPQALDSTFKAADVKSGTLERIAAVLGVGMEFFYPIGTTNTTNNHIKKQTAHNLHNGSGNITENVGPSQDALTIALQQNAELIALLKAEKGL